MAGGRCAVGLAVPFILLSFNIKQQKAQKNNNAVKGQLTRSLGAGG
jgi:hypothetical protein